ncbi:MAG: AsmA family protein [Alphaproteobacteria bacterium]
MGIRKIIGYSVVGVVGLTAVAAGGAFVYLQNADLAPFAVSLIEKQTGLAVKAEGPLTLKLLPQLELHAAKLTVPAYRGDKPLLTVDNADVTVAWGSGLTFWKGMTLTALNLTNPVVVLDKPKDGPANWQSAESYVAQVETKGDETASGMDAGKLPLASFGVVDVSNLNLTYTDASTGRKVVAEGINLKADGTDVGDAKLDMGGQVNGQPVSLAGAFNFTDLKRVPVTANLAAGTLKMAVDGEVREQSAYAGAVNIQSPNLQDSLAKLLGKAPAQAPAEAFSLTGDVDAGGSNVKLKNFNTKLGNLLRATGDVDVAMGDTPSANGSFMAEGNNLRQLVALATGKTNTSLPAKPFKISTKLAGQESIKLSGLNAEIQGVVAVAGDVTLVPAKTAGGLPKVDGQLRARSASLKGLAEGFGSNANLPNQPLDISLNIAGQGTYKLTDVTAQLGTLATLTGNMDITPQPTLKLAGSFAVKGANLAATAKAFGSTAALPASAYTASMTLGGDKRIEVSDLTISLPQLLEATGHMNLNPAAPYNAQGEITFNRLNLNALGYCQPASSGGTQTVNADAKPVAASGAAPWSDKPLPLDGLNSVALDMGIQVKALDCASFPAQNLSVNVANTASKLTVSDLNISMADGGSMVGGLTLGHGGNATLEANLTLANILLHKLVRTLEDKGVELPIHGTAKLTSKGSTTRQLAQNLAGKLDFKADDGRVPYVKMLGNISAISSLLQGQIPTQGSDHLRSMVAQYTVAGGVMSTDKLSMETDGLTLNGTGTVNLPAWTIDYTLTPEVSVGDKVSIPVLVQGSLGAPSIGPDKNFVSKLAARLATEGLKGALGLDKADAKGLGGVVGDVLGGKGLQGEGVQNLLNNVLKPKTQQPVPVTPAAETPTVESPATEPAAIEQPAAAAEPMPQSEPAKPEDVLKGAAEDALKNMLQGL